MVFPVLGANSPSGYEISNSIMFDGINTAGTWLKRTQTSSESTADKYKFTISQWCKLGWGGTSSGLLGFFTAAVDADNWTKLRREARPTCRLIFEHRVGGTTTSLTMRESLFDHAGWYHIVTVYDSTEGSAADRLKLYVNGHRMFTHGSWSGSQNVASWVGDNTATMHLCKDELPGRYNDDQAYAYTGNMADTVCTIGYALDPTYFGKTDPITGIWVPKKPDVTYSTNGFLLEYKQTGTSANSSGMGADTSGNDNHLAIEKGGAGRDPQRSIDSPTNNYCVLNPNDNYYAQGFPRAGNLEFVSQSASTTYMTSTFGMTKGKWYWEIYCVDDAAEGTDEVNVGVVSEASTSTSTAVGAGNNGPGHRNNGQRYQSGSGATHGASWTDGDVVGIAFDQPNSNMYVSKNGQWADGDGNSDEAAPTSAIGFVDNTGVQFAAVCDMTSSDQITVRFNFGADSTFATAISAGGNADANNQGDFKYAVPTGYYALNTTNLAKYG